MRDELRNLIIGRSKQEHIIRGLVGDGCGNVAVDSQGVNAWVRPHGRESPVSAYAKGGANGLAHNLIVRLKVVDVGGSLYYEILGVDSEAYGHSNLPQGSANVPLHAAQHQWSSRGSDVVLVHENQFLPLYMCATSPESMSVYITAGGWWHGGVYRYWPGGQTGSLSSYLPASGYGRYCLVYLDASTLEIGYTVGPDFPDVEPYIPEATEVDIPSPPNAMPVGLVRLANGMASIPNHYTFPQRNFLTPSSDQSGAVDLLVVMAQTDSVNKSLNGSLWTQIGDGEDYMEEGLVDIVVVNSQEWVLFREQAAADADDPLVYRTSDGGQNWAKSQEGLTFTQGSDKWGVWAVWRDPNNPYTIVVAIGKTETTSVPQIFVSTTGGTLWTEVSNTGLPTLDASAGERPTSLGVESATVPTICIALGDDGLYLKDAAVNWLQQDIDSQACWAVASLSGIGGGNFIAVSDAVCLRTTNYWSSYTTPFLYQVDPTSDEAYQIYVHPADSYHVAVGGESGVHTTPNASDFIQYPAMVVGQVGPVLRSIPGRPNTVYFTTSAAGALYCSYDACVNDVRALNVDGVIGIDGCVTSAAAEGTAAASSLLELWLKV